MADGTVVPHQALAEAHSVVGRGPGSKVFHLEEVPVLTSTHDGRRKQVLLNRTNTDAGLLADVVRLPPGGSSPADPDHELTVLQYFSSGRHETVFLGPACAWEP